MTNINLGHHVIQSIQSANLLMIMVDFSLLTISTKYGISANKDLRKKQPNNLNLQKILLLDIPFQHLSGSSLLITVCDIVLNVLYQIIQPYFCLHRFPTLCNAIQCSIP